MAYPEQRSCNRNLEEGMTDGTFKKVVQNRGGFCDPLTGHVRGQFDDIWHGIHELQLKIGADGLPIRTPDYEPTKPAEEI